MPECISSRHPSFAPPIDVLRRQPGLQGPDLLLKPGLKKHIVGIAPEEGGGQMSMGVYQAGNGQLPAAVDGLPFVFILEVASDPGNSVAFD